MRRGRVISQNSETKQMREWNIQVECEIWPLYDFIHLFCLLWLGFCCRKSEKFVNKKSSKCLRNFSPMSVNFFFLYSFNVVFNSCFHDTCRNFSENSGHDLQRCRMLTFSALSCATKNTESALFSLCSRVKAFLNSVQHYSWFVERRHDDVTVQIYFWNIVLTVAVCNFDKS